MTKHQWKYMFFLFHSHDHVLTILDSPGQSIGVSAILLGLILLGRAAFVFPLSFLSNLTKSSPDEKIDWKKQVTIWWAGLMRGAVSMALAYNQVWSVTYKKESKKRLLRSNQWGFNIYFFERKVLIYFPLTSCLLCHSSRLQDTPSFLEML